MRTWLRRHARQDCARQALFPKHRIARQDRRQRPRRRYPERRHGLADDIFAKHRTKRRTSVAVAGKPGRPRPLELDIAPRAIGVDHLADQQRASVAELRDETAELVTGIGERDRLRAVWKSVARQHFDPCGAPSHSGSRFSSKARAD